MKFVLLLIAVYVSWCSACRRCVPAITTVNGPSAPKGALCAGDLVFEDNFDTLDSRKWQHEISLAGGGNWEFQWYTNNRSNSFVEDGFLHLRPTLTSDLIGEEGLYSATINLNSGGDPNNQCTLAIDYGCLRTGTRENIINPIRSARVHTIDSFTFRYGKASIRAKIPSGDWQWPAIWFMPKENKYGEWPRSGEIDLMEARSNREYIKEGVNIGSAQTASTIHFGPSFEQNGWPTSHYSKNLVGNSYDREFHVYTLEWTPDYMRFLVDDEELGLVPTGNGFWERGSFTGFNPWTQGGLNAPFDTEFFLIMNLATGGTGGYFPDDAVNTGASKPWLNTSPRALTDFWERRDDWLPTWKLDEDNSNSASMIVDYVRIWAL